MIFLEEIQSLKAAVEAARKLSLERGETLMIVDYMGKWQLTLPAYHKYWKIAKGKILFVNEHGITDDY